MRRTIAAVTFGTLALAPLSASAGSLDVRLGAFFPAASECNGKVPCGNPNLFDDDRELYLKDLRPLEDSDWIGFSGGIAYNAKLARYLELSVHLDGYGRTLHTSARDFVSDSGREITQSLKFEEVPFGASLRIVPTGRNVHFAPFVLVGGDLVYWHYDEFGDFVDFETGDIIHDVSFHSDAVAPGFHVGGGLRIAVSDDVRLVAEYRYLWAHDDMGDDFRGNKIDLGGSYATLGVNIRF
jgi:opacity protein-like surface antigen